MGYHPHLDNYFDIGEEYTLTEEEFFSEIEEGNTFQPTYGLDGPGIQEFYPDGTCGEWFECKSLPEAKEIMERNGHPFKK